MGVEVLTKSCMWRIGNRQQINIFNGSWLPRPITFKPSTPLNLPKETFVAELIDENNC